jgi:hypothetical protein
MNAKRSDAQSLIDEYLDQVRRATATLPTGREELAIERPTGGGLISPDMLGVAAVSSLVTAIYLVLRLRRYDLVSTAPAPA